MIFENEFVKGSFNLFEHWMSYQFDYTYSSINHITDLSNWDKPFDGPTPQENDSDYERYNWYTIEWWDNALLHQIVNWEGYIFRELFNYKFNDYDYSIHSYDHLDEY